MTPQSVIRKYYGFQFFFSLLLWLPIFYEYQKRTGLNDAQIFNIQSIYYLVFCLFEIPTGFLADRFGYLKCMQAGALTLVVSNLLPIFSQNYDGFLIHFLLIALARSFISGASSAYLYEFLSSLDMSREYKKIEGRARSYSLVGKVVCWAGIGLLMKWHLTLPYWLTAFSALVSLGFACVLPRLRVQSPPKKENQWVHITRVLNESPFLLLVMFQGIGIFVLARICQVSLFQPILASKSFDLGSYGAIMSLMTIFEAIGSAKPQWLQKGQTDLRSVFWMTLLMAGSLIFIPSAGKWGTLVCLCLFSIATGVSFPIQRQLLNHAIRESRYRATLMSLESLIDRGVNAVVAGMIGGYLSQGKLSQFLVLSGSVSILFIFILYLVLKLMIGEPKYEKTV